MILLTCVSLGIFIVQIISIYNYFLGYLENEQTLRIFDVSSNYQESKLNPHMLSPN